MSVLIKRTRTYNRVFNIGLPIVVLFYQTVRKLFQMTVSRETETDPSHVETAHFSTFHRIDRASYPLGREESVKHEHHDS